MRDPVVGLSRLDAEGSWVVHRIFYRLLVGLVGLAVRSDRSKDLEIIVLYSWPIDSDDRATRSRTA